MQQTLGWGWKFIDIRQTLEAAKDKRHDHFCREGSVGFSKKKKGEVGTWGKKWGKRRGLKKGIKKGVNQKDGQPLEARGTSPGDAPIDQGSEGLCLCAEMRQLD